MKKIVALVNRKTDNLDSTSIDGINSKIDDDSVIGNEYEECVEFVSLILVKESPSLSDGTPSMIVTIKGEDEGELTAYYLGNSLDYYKNKKECSPLSGGKWYLDRTIKSMIDSNQPLLMPHNRDPIPDAIISDLKVYDEAVVDRFLKNDESKEFVSYIKMFNDREQNRAFLQVVKYFTSKGQSLNSVSFGKGSLLHLSCDLLLNDAIFYLSENGYDFKSDNGYEENMGSNQVRRISSLFNVSKNNQNGVVHALKKCGYDFKNDKGSFFGDFSERDHYSKETSLNNAISTNSDKFIIALKDTDYDFGNNIGKEFYYPRPNSLEQVSCVANAIKNGATNAVSALSETTYPFETDFGSETHIGKNRATAKLIARTTNLYLAAERDNVDVVRVLVSKGYKVKEDVGHVIYSSEGNLKKRCSSLSIAAEKNAASVIRVMGENEYDIQSDFGRELYGEKEEVFEKMSSLYVAAKENAFEVIGPLVANGYALNNDFGKETFENGVRVVRESSVFAAEREGCFNFVQGLNEHSYDFGSDFGRHEKGGIFDRFSSPLDTVSASSQRYEDLKAMGCKHMRVYDSIATLIPRAVGGLIRLMS
ncbi:hypothetical protein HOG98_00935 [bacterium]|jgi:hypothetical protein|nr:hypothetical protein [bacterium]